MPTSTSRNLVLTQSQTVAFASSNFFFFNDTASTEIYTLSLHDALPISARRRSPDDSARPSGSAARPGVSVQGQLLATGSRSERSEEHTSELQSQSNLVCRLLPEKKNAAPGSDRVVGAEHHRRDLVDDFL